MVDERRSQIIDAYLSLTLENRHPNTSIKDIAERAGVHRAAVRHFVGNRVDLIAAVVEEVWARHHAAFTDALGDAPTFDETVDYFFSEHYVHELADVDEVLTTLMAAAADEAPIREQVRANYQRTITDLAAMADPTIPDAEAAAYQFLCIAEHNVVMQRLGFDPALSRSARQLARAALSPPSGR